MYIDDTGWDRQRVKRKPHPNHSWLVIVAPKVELIEAVWAKVEELLEVPDKLCSNSENGGKALNGEVGRKSRMYGEEEGRDRIVHRFRIPAAKYFSKEQRLRFDAIKVC